MRITQHLISGERVNRFNVTSSNICHQKAENRRQKKGLRTCSPFLHLLRLKNQTSSPLRIPSSSRSIAIRVPEPGGTQV